jgi:hypothetical protein
MSAAVSPGVVGELQAELGLVATPIQSVEEWLDRLQLPQYKQLFEDNAIQLIDLDLLTADLLCQIGIKPLGHRLAMVRGAGLMAAQERYTRRNYVLTPEFSDYCDCNACFATTYKITSATLTVTSRTCCNTKFDPVDLTDVTDVNYGKGCCCGSVVINTVDASMALIKMRLTNKDAERIAALILQAKEREESELGNSGSASGPQPRGRMAKHNHQLAAQGKPTR